MHDDATDLPLHAWLDGELSDEAARTFTARLAEDAELRAEAEHFRQTDRLVRDWYQSLPVETAPPRTVEPAQPHAARRRWRWAALVAAAVLLAFLGRTLWPQRAAALSAAEVIQRAGEEIAAAAGLRVEFTAAFMQRLPLPDGNTRAEERTARGEIRYGPLWAERLEFRCQETWLAADEPELQRSWGQTATGQWLVEKQGGSVTSELIAGAFNPAVPRNGWVDLQRGASPVDPRTRQAVEGLALLVRSFRRDPYLHWLGDTWQLTGGQGTKALPWSYRLEPDAGTSKRWQTVWTLQLSARAEATLPAPVLDAVEVCETITDSRTGAVQSAFHTVYQLELRDTPWPEPTFRAE